MLAECSTFTQTLNGSDGGVAGCGAKFSCIAALIYSECGRQSVNDVKRLVWVHTIALC